MIPVKDNTIASIISDLSSAQHNCMFFCDFALNDFILCIMHFSAHYQDLLVPAVVPYHKGVLLLSCSLQYTVLRIGTLKQGHHETQEDLPFLLNSNVIWLFCHGFPEDTVNR